MQAIVARNLLPRTGQSHDLIAAGSNRGEKKMATSHQWGAVIGRGLAPAVAMAAMYVWTPNSALAQYTRPGANFEQPRPTVRVPTMSPASLPNPPLFGSGAGGGLIARPQPGSAPQLPFGSNRLDVGSGPRPQPTTSGGTLGRIPLSGASPLVKDHRG